MNRGVFISVITASVFAAAGAGLIAWKKPANARPLLRPGNAAIVENGKAIYTTQCVSCHGVNLEGQPNWKTPFDDGRMKAPPHDATGHTWHHPDDLLFRITKLGTAVVTGLDIKTDMKGFKEILTDEEIIAVLSFIKSTWSEKIRKRHDNLNRNRRK